MKIAIIGTGNVGSALAVGWSRGGHEIVLGVRRPSDPDVLALAATTKARVMSPSDAVQSSDVIVLALPWQAAEAAVGVLGDLTGKIVIDCMNPLVFANGALSLERGFTTSGAETLAGWIPAARIVKTLNQVGAEIMEQAHGFDSRPVMFLAGDDQGAKAQVATLLGDLGFEALDAGDLTKSRLLEPFGMVWINQALARGAGRDWALGIVRPPKTKGDQSA